MTPFSTKSSIIFELKSVSVAGVFFISVVRRGGDNKIEFLGVRFKERATVGMNDGPVGRHEKLV